MLKSQRFVNERILIILNNLLKKESVQQTKYKVDNFQNLILIIKHY